MGGVALSNTLRKLSDLSIVRGTSSQQEEHRGDSQWRSFLSCTEWIHSFDVVILHFSPTAVCFMGAHMGAGVA